MYRSVLLFSTAFCIFLFAQPVFSYGTQHDDQSGAPTPYDWKKSADYSRRYTKKSFYLTMEDSVKLAVTLYLPANLSSDKKIPAILYQTRYWRGVQLRWPFNWLTEIVPSTSTFPVLEFVHAGYALVCVDVRGSGASFGNKIQALPDTWEIRDGARVVDWIIRQPWSNGRVGATGISYIGNAALYLLMNGHPAVKAVVPVCSVYDVYDDMALPGGILFERFLKHWNHLCRQLDKNTVGFSVSRFRKMMIKGVEPVKSAPKSMLKEAIAFHSCNLYLDNEGYSPVYMDDTTTLNGLLQVSEIHSPHLYNDVINRSGAAIYSYSGWYDGALQHAAIRQFLNFTNPDNKLIIGPWDHGIIHDISPYKPGRAEFDHISEVIKFFDYHLKEINNGLYDEPRVHYYTIGAEEWRASDTWPPEGAVDFKFYFNEGNKLTVLPPRQSGSFDTYIYDTTFGTGEWSRWNFNFPDPSKGLPDAGPDEITLLAYESAPLSEDVEITGHPLATLYVSSTAEDPALFLYLDDVDQEGRVTRVSEAQLRLIHRKVHDKPVYYNDVVPFRSYARSDAMPVHPGEVMKVVMDFYPVSYLFKKGHRMRVAVSGGDRTHFKALTPQGTIFKIYHDNEHSSFINLPVMQRSDKQTSSTGMTGEKPGEAR